MDMSRHPYVALSGIHVPGKRREATSRGKREAPHPYNCHYPGIQTPQRQGPKRAGAQARLPATTRPGASQSGSARAISVIHHDTSRDALVMYQQSLLLIRDDNGSPRNSTQRQSIYHNDS